MLTKHGVSMAGCECQRTSREDWVVVAVQVVGCDAEDTAVEGPSWHNLFGVGLKSESESKSASDSSSDSERSPSLSGVQLVDCITILGRKRIVPLVHCRPC